MSTSGSLANAALVRGAVLCQHHRAAPARLAGLASPSRLLHLSSQSREQSSLLQSVTLLQPSIGHGCLTLDGFPALRSAGRAQERSEWWGSHTHSPHLSTHGFPSLSHFFHTALVVRLDSPPRCRHVNGCGRSLGGIIHKNGFPEAETEGSSYLNASGTTWIAFWKSSASHIRVRCSAHLENICLRLVIWHRRSRSHCKTGPCGKRLMLLDMLCFVLMVK